MKQEKWHTFVSLSWYDAFIEFTFKLVAKTSEPLLAAGLVISAADYLSHGAVMAGHPAFSLGWAWAQALALESSSGVVFVYALQAFRTKDNVKGAIYLALALLLAVVGGGMLLLQVNAISLGTSESATPWLNVMRVVVSIAYIFLLRAKSIRFSDLADTREQPVQVPDVDRIVDAIVERALERVNVAMEMPVQPALPEPERPVNLQPIYGARFESKEATIAMILRDKPDASVQEVAQLAQCNERTAEKWMKRYQEGT